jgi:hypothetical protein
LELKKESVLLEQQFDFDVLKSAVEGFVAEIMAL